MKCVKCGKQVTLENSVGLENHLYCMDCANEVSKKYKESFAETVEWICYEGYLRQNGDITKIN